MTYISSPVPKAMVQIPPPGKSREWIVRTINSKHDSFTVFVACYLLYEMVPLLLPVAILEDIALSVPQTRTSSFLDLSQLLLQLKMKSSLLAGLHSVQRTWYSLQRNIPLLTSASNEEKLSQRDPILCRLQIGDVCCNVQVHQHALQQRHIRNNP